MEGILFLIVGTLMVAIASYLKLRRCIAVMDFHPFDVDATLAVRGILAILIVLCHFGGYINPIPTQLALFSKIGAPVCSVFFFISGYGLMISYMRKGDFYLKDFFRNRMSKLLPVFLLLTIICILYYCVIISIPFIDIMNCFSYGIPPLKNSWFIYAIILLYIYFYISCKFSHGKPKLIICYVSLLTLISVITMVILGWGAHWFISLPSFALGIFIASYEYKLKEQLISYLFIIILAIVGIMVFSMTIVRDMFPFFFMRINTFCKFKPINRFIGSICLWND